MKVFSIIGKQKMRDAMTPKIIKALEEDGHTVGFIKKTDNISSNSHTKKAIVWGDHQSLFYNEEKQVLLDLLELFDEEYIIVDNDEKSNIQKLLMYEEANLENTSNIEELGQMDRLKRREDVFLIAEEDTDFDELIKTIKEEVVDLQPDEDILLTMGGKEIPLGPFEKKILKNNIEAIVKEIDGYKENEDLVVRIRR